MDQTFLTSPIIYLILAWTLPWTPPTYHPPASRAPGVALWKAARNSHKGWFIALFLINTLAILEIIYIFYFSKKRHQSTSDIRIYK